MGATRVTEIMEGARERHSVDMQGDADADVNVNVNVDTNVDMM